VRIYLDLCCLKRPFDLQEQPLIRLQAEAVLSILALVPDTVELLQSPALHLENSMNPNQARREAVALLLSAGEIASPKEADITARIDELLAKGFKSFDAFHLATAELADAAFFLTVDGELLKVASRLPDQLHVPVTDPIRFIVELSQWKH